MIIINTETGTETNLRALLRLLPRIGSTANPSQGIRTTWADQPTPEQIASVWYQYLVETEQPVPGVGEQVRQGAHALVEGQWVRVWVVEAMDQQVEARRLAGVIQEHLDAEAQRRQFDSIFTAVTYVDDANQQFADDAAALKAWRSAVWTYAYGVQAAVMAGERAPPTDAQLLAELPQAPA
jgi:hypothetical protein